MCPLDFICLLLLLLFNFSCTDLLVEQPIRVGLKAMVPNLEIGSKMTDGVMDKKDKNIHYT